MKQLPILILLMLVVFGGCNQDPKIQPRYIDNKCDSLLLLNSIIAQKRDSIAILKTIRAVYKYSTAVEKWCIKNKTYINIDQIDSAFEKDCPNILIK